MSRDTPGRLVAAVLAAAAVGLFGPSAAHAAYERHCSYRLDDPAMGNVCAHEFTATAKPTKLVVLGRGVEGYVSAWTRSDGRQFIAGKLRGCSSYGRLGDVRVRETFVGGRLVVVLHSVGAPVDVSLYWHGFRRGNYPPSQCDADKTAALPELQREGAEALMRAALADKFGGYFTEAVRTKLSCNKRRSRVRIACRVGWVTGDFVFYGKGRVWLSVGRSGQTHTNVAGSITRVNDYCVSVEHLPVSRCTERYRIRA